MSQNQNDGGLIKVLENNSGLFIEPPLGEHRGVIVGYQIQDQVEDPTYGTVNDKLRFLYQIEERITEALLLEAAGRAGVPVTDNDREKIGQRIVVYRERWKNRKLSLNGASKQTGLNEYLNLVLGHTLTNEEIRSFHPKGLFGTPVALNITPSDKADKKGRPYQNIKVSAWSKFAGEGLKPEGDLIFIPHRDYKKEEAKTATA